MDRKQKEIYGQNIAEVKKLEDKHSGGEIMNRNLTIKIN